VFLIRLSRIPLALIASHPDLAGGAAALKRPTAAFALIGAGITATVVAASAERALEAGSMLPLAPVLGVIVVGVLVVVFGPLFPFAGQMLWARGRGLGAHGRLALRYVRRFEDKHIERGSSDDELLGSPDLQSLADLGTAYDVVRRMRAIPFDRRALVMTVILVLVPAVPLAIAITPLPVIVARLAKTVIGVP
jgi:hypothetical protein